MELGRLRHVFRNSLELPDDFAVDDLEYRGNAQWDSLAHMSLVAAIEDEFGVMLDTDEVIDLSSFNRARQILEKHGVVLVD
ncbi:acyl carrier protein [Salinispora arenicola]|uniref:Acyl carrier protein n=1 Tax=Salinispora arenicola TaxID=168697 RepID=A0A542XUD8_SALAC|nr:acyl carrier protein [Salinispora arenicola]MCN0152481.1 acyl carrier protein [Salinispora arenicola]NIL40826.1 acyl carrier protein [Salinispora arenicola]TQL39412.1 acyl carrier protein [Salinispora arenicola]GIM87670.1 acyl carrier protein [Salinispora arenicola]